jgi:hypothetical protein
MAIARTSTLSVERSIENDRREIPSVDDAGGGVSRRRTMCAWKKFRCRKSGRGKFWFASTPAESAGPISRRLPPARTPRRAFLGTKPRALWRKSGKGVRKFSVGERVVVFHHIPCGECYYCRHKTFAQCATYKKVGCTAGFEPSGGGFAEYVRVMDWIVEKGTVRIPDGVSFEQAVLSSR